MRKHPQLLLLFIAILTVLAIIIDMANNTPIGFDTKLFGKKISFHKTFSSTPFNNIFGSNFQHDFAFKKGLDLSGGTSVTLRADMKGIGKDKRQDALDSAKNVIERRTNLFGVSEPVIQTSSANGDYRIIVDLPGIDVNQAVNLIGTTAQLTFWEEGASGSAQQATPSALPMGMQGLYTNPHKTNLAGSDLQNVSVTFDQQTGQPQIQLQFTSEGGQKFGDITKRNVGKRVAMVLDNTVIEAPTVQEPILTGTAVINGQFTADQAKAISVQLRAGALPVPLSVLEQHEIGATLGNEYLQKILFAGIIGFLIIVIFMIGLYRSLGIIASIALILYTLFVMAIFKTIPITMTLAGIAGFVLSIGMAVDANILIFERMKEELRLGRTTSAAIELGFSRAWTSIRDSNISTLITSFVLYEFGNGIVRGFAITLAIGVLVSMFSAIVVTRTFIRNFYTKNLHKNI